MGYLTLSASSICSFSNDNETKKDILVMLGSIDRSMAPCSLIGTDYGTCFMVENSQCVYAFYTSFKSDFNGHLFVHFCSFKKHSKETSTYAEFELESSK